MKLVIVTGMSGAGKSTTMKMMEDMGFFCVDNLPIPLLSKMCEFSEDFFSDAEKVALGVDIRSGKAMDSLKPIIEEFERKLDNFQILFLESSDDVLLKRYKETRRNHPLAGDGRLESGIEKERSRMEYLKGKADYIIDTSRLLTRELKAELEKIFMQQQDFKSLFVTILSFGFKYGIPADSDIVMDVRFLPNPYYVEGLRAKTGNDPEIQNFVMQYEEAQTFLNKLSDMIEFLIPNYISEGKNQLVIAIGCTGGKHRSVTLANALYQRLSESEGSYGIKIEHRDLEKDAARGK